MKVTASQSRLPGSEGLPGDFYFAGPSQSLGCTE